MPVEVEWNYLAHTLVQHVHRHNLSHFEKEVMANRREKSVLLPSPNAITNRNLKFSSNDSTHTFVGRLKGLTCVYDINGKNMLHAVNELEALQFYSAGTAPTYGDHGTN